MSRFQCWNPIFSDKCLPYFQRTEGEAVPAVETDDAPSENKDVVMEDSTEGSTVVATDLVYDPATPMGMNLKDLVTYRVTEILLKRIYNYKILGSG